MGTVTGTTAVATGGGLLVAWMLGLFKLIPFAAMAIIAYGVFRIVKKDDK